LAPSFKGIASVLWVQAATSKPNRTTETLRHGEQPFLPLIFADGR
jgi:hypothetical protein